VVKGEKYPARVGKSSIRNDTDWERGDMEPTSAASRECRKDINCHRIARGKKSSICKRHMMNGMVD
jgi:hypothetical protein